MDRLQQTKWPRGLGAAVMAGAALLVLAGCLPQDQIQALAWSPDGTALAVATEERGLSVVELDGEQRTTLVRSGVEGSVLAWAPDASAITFESSAAGSRDLVTALMDGSTTVAASTHARESHPFHLASGDLAYLSSAEGVYALDATDRGHSGPRTLARLPADILSPALSPDGTRIAFISFENLAPQLFVLDMVAGRYSRVTSETTPLGLETDTVVWTPDSRGVIVRRASTPAPRTGATSAAPQSAESWDRRQQMLCRIETADPVRGRETVLAREDGRVARPSPAPDGTKIIYRWNSRIVQRAVDGSARRVLNTENFRMGLPSLAPDGATIAMAAEDQLLAVTDWDFAPPRFLITLFEDKFILAEEYFRKGKNDKTAQLYAELAGVIDRTGDPELARFYQLATQVRLRRSADAVREIEAMAAANRLPPQVRLRDAWRMLGYARLLWLHQPEPAHECFRRYAEQLLRDGLTTDTDTDSALNALAILDTGDKTLITLFARGMRARMQPDYADLTRSFFPMLERYGSLSAVRAEYLKALQGYDREVYVLVPTEHPFEPSRAQRIRYLEHYAALPDRDRRTDGVEAELFRLYIETGQYDTARDLMMSALVQDSGDAPVEGAADLFSDYLDRPEAEPWLQEAMRLVFLNPGVRPSLEERLAEPYPLFLLHLVAAKLALVDGDADTARTEANGALTQWSRLPAGTTEAHDHARYARLLAIRGREAELRGLHAEAASLYGQAAEYLASSRADDFPFYYECQFRSGMLNALAADEPDFLARVTTIERAAGDDLINPLGDRAALARAALQYHRLYLERMAGEQPGRFVAAYMLGSVLRQLGDDTRARPAFMEAASTRAPGFVRVKALWELSGIDDNLGDPYNSARWLLQAAEQAESTPYGELFFSYRIAQNHLVLGIHITEARSALEALAQTVPNSPLATMAAELVINAAASAPSPQTP